MTLHLRPTMAYATVCARLLMGAAEKLLQGCEMDRGHSLVLVGCTYQVMFASVDRRGGDSKGRAAGVEQRRSSHWSPVAYVSCQREEKGVSCLVPGHGAAHIFFRFLSQVALVQVQARGKTARPRF